MDSENSGGRGTTPWSSAAGRQRWVGDRWWRRARQLAHQRWQCDASGLEHAARKSGRVWAQQKAFASRLDRHLLEAIEIARDIAPRRRPPCVCQPFVELLAQQEGEEGAKQVASDGGVGLRVDRPRLQDRFCGPEDGFHFP